jgi:quinol monooxygenase YgiN
MAIGVVFEGIGVSQDQYQQVFDQVISDRQPPPGLVTHVAGTSENGMVVFEVWDSQEAVRQFFEEKLGQAMQQANINVQPRFIQIVNTLQP